MHSLTLLTYPPTQSASLVMKSYEETSPILETVSQKYPFHGDRDAARLPLNLGYRLTVLGLHSQRRSDTIVLSITLNKVTYEDICKQVQERMCVCD